MEELTVTVTLQSSNKMKLTLNHPPQTAHDNVLSVLI